MKILIIEDNTELQKDIKTFLAADGNVCEVASNYREATEKIITYPYDILIVDLVLPFGDGLDIIQLVKKESLDAGIIVISARDELQERIRALEIGADDYLTKPFFLTELNARVKALFRRKAQKGNKDVHFNELTIRPEQYELRVHGKPLKLTRKEFDIMHFFMVNPDRLLTKEALAEHLWGDHIENMDSFDFIYTHIANLRKKITKLKGKDYIKSIYSVGYKFTDLE